MKITCPKCSVQIVTENINVSKDIALCQKCGEAIKISKSFDDLPDIFDINTPPPGAKYEETYEGRILTASTRSPMAFFLVPFIIVWSGGSLGGIYGSQFASGEFNPFMSLFGLPFLIGTVVLSAVTLISIAGQIRIRLLNDECVLFTGIGTLGWYRKFRLDEINTIREENSNSGRYGRGNTKSIVLEGKTRIKFGSMLNEKRRYYILNALKYMKTI